MSGISPEPGKIETEGTWAGSKADLPRKYQLEFPQAIIELSERDRRRLVRGSERELSLDD